MQTRRFETFKAGMAAAKAARGKFAAEWDAGEGWTARAFFCPQRRRVVVLSINPHGVVVV